MYNTLILNDNSQYFAIVFGLTVVGFSSVILPFYYTKVDGEVVSLSCDELQVYECIMIPLNTFVIY